MRVVRPGKTLEYPEVGNADEVEDVTRRLRTSGVVVSRVGACVVAIEQQEFAIWRHTGTSADHRKITDHSYRALGGRVVDLERVMAGPSARSPAFVADKETFSFTIHGHVHGTGELGKSGGIAGCRHDASKAPARHGEKNFLLIRSHCEIEDGASSGDQPLDGSEACIHHHHEGIRGAYVEALSISSDRSPARRMGQMESSFDPQIIHAQLGDGSPKLLDGVKHPAAGLDQQPCGLIP